MVVEFSQERSEARKQLTDCKKYNPPGIRGIDDIKWYIWSKTEGAERKQFSESGILKFKISKDKQL